MRFHQHASTNTLLTAPMGLEGEVDTMPVTRSDLGGIHTMQSFWRPDEFELAALNRGSSVMLTILGTFHPPVKVEVTDPDA